MSEHRCQWLDVLMILVLIAAAAALVFVAAEFAIGIAEGA